MVSDAESLMFEREAMQIREKCGLSKKCILKSAYLGPVVRGKVPTRSSTPSPRDARSDPDQDPDCLPIHGPKSEAGQFHSVPARFGMLCSSELEKGTSGATQYTIYFYIDINII